MLSKLRAKHLIGLVSLLVPLVILGFGISGLTWLRPSPYITVTAPPSSAQMVMTGKNVLESTSESVTVTARAPRDQEVFLGVALTSDVQAFIAPSDHEVLADFSGADGFVIKKISGKKTNSANSEQAKSPTGKAPHDSLQKPAHPDQADASDLRKLDIWTQRAIGKGSVSLKWTLSDSRWSAVAFVGNGTAKATVPPPGDKASPTATPGKDGKKPAKTATAKTQGPSLQLRWHHEPSLAPAWFLTIIGALAFSAVLVYIVLSLISEFRSRARRLAAEEMDKTIRLAAEAVGEVQASSHPRRRALRRAAEMDEEPSADADSSAETPDSETTGEDAETTPGAKMAPHESPDETEPTAENEPFAEEKNQ